MVEPLKISQSELEALEMRRPMSPVDWVQKYLRVPAKNNFKPKIDLDLTPYLKQPVELLADKSVKRQWIVAPTQSAKTVFLQAAVAFTVDQDPGPILYILPTEKDAARSIEQKLMAIINESPKLSSHKTKLQDDFSKVNIKLDSCDIYPAWAGSSGSMSSYPMQLVCWDEIRLLKESLGNDSNAIKQGEDRLTTYEALGLAKGVGVSSPTVQGDMVWHLIKNIPNTLIFYWHVPCLSCKKYQRLDFFTHIKKFKNKGTFGYTAKCLCQYCGNEFGDKDNKMSWNQKGVYAPVSLSDEGEIELIGAIKDDGTITGPKLAERVVHWWDSLASPFRSFQTIWNEFVATKDNVNDYMNFWETWLARFWKEQESSIGVTGLSKLRSNYLSGSVPQDVEFLLGGVDTQDSGFYWTVWGFGYNLQKEKIVFYLISSGYIQAVMDLISEEEILFLIKSNVLDRAFAKPDGTKLKPIITPIDSGGHRTQEIYRVCNREARLIPVKGRNNQSRRVIFSKSARIWTIRTIEYLEETEKATESGDFFFLPENVDEDFLKQFQNHKKVKRVVAGLTRFSWESKGPDHLRLASCYCWAGLDIQTSVGALRSKFGVGGFFEGLNKALMKSSATKAESQTRPTRKNSLFIDDGDFWAGR